MWRKIQGNPNPGDDELLNGAKEGELDESNTRGTW